MRVCVPGRGRVSPCAEFNFFNDPEAAFIVLASMSNIRLLPYEVCCRHNLSWVKNCLHKFCFISTLQMLGYFFVLCFPTYIKWKAKASVCCCLLLFTFIWHHSALSSRLTALVACDSKWVTCRLTCYMAGATCNCCHLGMFCVHHTAMHHVASIIAMPYTQRFSCNLQPALFAEWLGSFTCNWGNTWIDWVLK